MLYTSVLCFIDYSKAFDCVCHQKLWNIMREMGFPNHIVKLISKLYEDQESAVRTSRGDTDWFMRDVFGEFHGGELMNLLKAVKTASEERGLLLNAKKTKIMVVDGSHSDADRIFSLDGDVIEELANFEFLSSVINAKGNYTQEIKRRLLFKSKLPSSLKVRLLRSTAFAVASYGSESWTMKSADKLRVDFFESGSGS
uniref:Reverse transcriptase domain-containing protein n=1 Tax=Amphiprion percula TaxID=161767 RepID=A0A3P8T8L0_AMPPE